MGDGAYEANKNIKNRSKKKLTKAEMQKLNKIRLRMSMRPKGILPTGGLNKKK